MSNRKESLKKSLGITEYPWSSDDDETETTPTAPEIQVMRRQRGEADISRSAAVDAPSTSAQPSTSSSNSQNATRRSQLFWSLSLSNPHRVSSISLPRTSSRLEMPLSLVSRERAGERGERAERGGERGRGSPAADVQRILAIRKLNRNLTMYRANRTAANLYAMQRSNSARTSRDSYRECFSTPSVALTTDVSALIKARSRNRNLPRQIPDPARNGPTLNEAVVGESAASSSAYSRRPTALGSAPSVEPVTLDHSDDDVELPPSTLSAPTIRSDINLEPDAPTEGGPHDVSGMSLEEEIVEIDMEPEPAAAGDAQPAEEGAPNEEPVANTSSASDEQQPHGVKRKRESVDDNNEPCSVREFNQSLLRLLECPVCLEWMEPPMSQCRRGHLVCTRCRARLAACPVCRTAFSSVRNRAMEGVAEMLRYPCRHGCGRDLRLRRRAAHEASCSARRYRCPAPACADRPPLPHADLPHHFQGKHLSMLKIGRKHKFSMKVNSEQHDNWVIMALHELFHLRVDVDIRTWGVVVYVAYIGPKCNATDYTYEVTVIGQHNSRKLVYTRATHCDLECSSLNVSRQDCFHLTLDQALNFLRVKNRHCEPDKFLNFNVEITKCENSENREDSDS